MGPAERERLIAELAAALAESHPRPSISGTRFTITIGLAVLPLFVTLVLSWSNMTAAIQANVRAVDEQRALIREIAAELKHTREQQIVEDQMLDYQADAIDELRHEAGFTNSKKGARHASDGAQLK
jgi:hypothetical protein